LKEKLKLMLNVAEMSIAAEKLLLSHRDVRKKKANAPRWFIKKATAPLPRRDGL
jgi:hypothetical protein